MRKCYLQTPTPNKAKADIDEIARRAGFADLAVHAGSGGKVQTFFSKLLTVVALPFRLRKDDVLLIQYPYKKYYATLCRIARLKGAKTVTLIHDLGTFRRHKLTDKQEIQRLSHTEYIIAHNAAMAQWLREHGCQVLIGELEIFDYLEATQPQTASPTPEHTRIVYAGGLGPRKNAFLYDMDQYLGPCTMQIYGKGLDTEVTKKWIKIKYEGFMPSDKFVATVRGDWGLVWDGDSLDGCSGNWGEYLRINNPHKTSFYLRAGLPVIMWSESAMAPFVLREGIGIVVDTLRELPHAIAAVSDADYCRIKANVEKMREKLDRGHYFHKAFDAALSKIQ